MNLGIYCVSVCLKRVSKFTFVKPHKFKTMRKIFAALFILCSTITMAQKQTDDNTPQKIEGIVKVRMPIEWYIQQSKLWEQKVMSDTSNEDSWQNWLAALHYAATMNEDKTDESLIEKRSRALKLLSEKLPDSPTRYILEMWIKGPLHPDCDKMSDELLSVVKNNLDRVEFYDNYIAYLLMKHPWEESLIKEICNRWYRSSDYPTSMLNHFYNELSGLPEWSIIIGSGDLSIYSYLILQNVKGLFGNIIPVCSPLLYVKEYREHLCRKLNIPMMDDADTNDINKMFMHIIKHSNRPVFFSSTSPMPSFTEKLYSEGLVSRYSEKRYDNIAAKRRNFEDNYLLDYLREDFEYSFPVYQRIKMNYVTVFASLLDHYKKTGNMQQYKRLHKLLKGIIESNTVLSDEEKLYYEQQLDK